MYDVSRNEKIASFIEQTGADQETAICYLESEEWIVYEAVYMFNADKKNG